MKNMGLVIPQDLFSTLRYKHLLLDTNIFIDALLHPSDFTDFFNKLKNAEITLATIDLVKIEFLRGAADDATYNQKEEVLKKITDIILPTDSSIIQHSYSLIKKYKAAGKTLAMADLYLGASLFKYPSTLFLLTRNVTDYPMRIFNINFIINYPIDRGIFTYGIYTAK